jgi:hypothetical protein
MSCSCWTIFSDWHLIFSYNLHKQGHKKQNLQIEWDQLQGYMGQNRAIWGKNFRGYSYLLTLTLASLILPRIEHQKSGLRKSGMQPIPSGLRFIPPNEWRRLELQHYFCRLQRVFDLLLTALWWNRLPHPIGQIIGTDYLHKNLQGADSYCHNPEDED